MKKLFLLTVLTVVGLLSVGAQEGNHAHQFTQGWQQGNWYGSADVSFWNSSQGDNKDNFFTFNPCVGYFFTNSLVAGVELLYDFDKTESGSSEFKDTTLGVGPFLKWFCTPEKQFSPFIGAHVNYISITDDNGSTEVDSNGLRVGASLGFNYWVSDWLTLKAEYAGLSYQTTKVDAPGAEAENILAAGLDLKSFSIGAGVRLDELF